MTVEQAEQELITLQTQLDKLREIEARCRLLKEFIQVGKELSQEGACFRWEPI